MVNLLTRFYNPSSGKILIDGQDITSYKLKDLRNQFAYVSQQVVLFNDSIANNIAYGELENHSREAIIDAAKKANAWDFIQEQSDGLDTNIGEGGLMLSGGQRQRIGIAGALYREAKIILFDEATNQLDTDTESLVMQSINNLNKEVTIIFIAHRLSTLKNCDQIIDFAKLLEK
mgnify:CR=1 FL=1